MLILEDNTEAMSWNLKDKFVHLFFFKETIKVKSIHETFKTFVLMYTFTYI